MQMKKNGATRYLVAGGTPQGRDVVSWALSAVSSVDMVPLETENKAVII